MPPSEIKSVSLVGSLGSRPAPVERKIAVQTTIITLYQESNSSFDKGFSIFSISWLCENTKDTTELDVVKRQAHTMLLAAIWSFTN